MWRNYQMKNKLSISLVLIVSILLLSSIVVQASIASEAVDYTWGKTASGRVGTGYSENHYYKFSLSDLKHVSIVYRKSFQNNDEYIRLYDVNGDYVIESTTLDRGFSYNNVTGWYSNTYSKDLPAGDYYIQIHSRDYWNYYSLSYELDIFLEDVKEAPRGKIKSISCPAKGSMKITAESVKNAEGYDFEYADNYKFENSQVQTSSKPSLTVSSLEPIIYYCRVRPFIIYANDGVEVYGQYSQIGKVDLGNPDTAPAKKPGKTAINKIGDLKKGIYIKWTKASNTDKYVVERDN